MCGTGTISVGPAGARKKMGPSFHTKQQINKLYIMKLRVKLSLQSINHNFYNGLTGNRHCNCRLIICLFSQPCYACTLRTWTCL